MLPRPSYSLQSASRSLFGLDLSLIRNLNSLFRFLGNFNVSRWNRHAFAHTNVEESIKSRLFPVFFPVNRELPSETGSQQTASTAN